MELTPLQTDLFRRLRSAIETTSTYRVIYCSEWLGYLPYGVYHWVEVDNQDISASLPPDWSHQDLEALEKAGLLTTIEADQNPEDAYETTITYEVMRTKLVL